MTITKLTRNDLAPDTESYQALFAQADLAHAETSLSGELQPDSSMAGAAHGHSTISPFMLVKIPEEPEYLQWLANETRTLHQPAQTLCGVRYQVDGGKISLSPAQTAEDNFASVAPVEAADWIEAEQLLAACASLMVKSRYNPVWSIALTAGY